MPELISVAIACPNCGAKPTELKFTYANVKDASIASCNACGASLCDYAEIRERVAKSEADELGRALYASFKAANWTI
ncbi:MAG: hypothetical protein KJ755_13255 [Alphaproteobacteria bacterium]|nr:hypothetical protein [Alphaproteobacteria bacterium]